MVVQISVGVATLVCLVGLVLVRRRLTPEAKALRAERRARRMQEEDAERVQRLLAIAARVKARSMEENAEQAHRRG
jgi:hypothetical protein